MKMFYNVVNAIIFCAKEARASIVLDIKWVQFVFQNCENCRIIGLNREKKKKFCPRSVWLKKKKKKEKTAPHSTVYLGRDQKKDI